MIKGDTFSVKVNVFVPDIHMNRSCDFPHTTTAKLLHMQLFILV